MRRMLIPHLQNSYERLQQLVIIISHLNLHRSLANGTRSSLLAMDTLLKTEVSRTTPSSTGHSHHDQHNLAALTFAMWNKYAIQPAVVGNV